MKRFFDFIRGTAVVQLSGAEPQRCLNRFASERLPFWDVKLVDDYTLTCRVYRRDLEFAARQAGRAMCTCTILRHEGLRREFYGLRRRKLLLLGSLLVLAGLIVLPNFVWTVQVQGNVEIPEEQILQELETLGVHFGAWGPSIESRKIKNEMLCRLGDLRWLAVNCSGGKATVLVSERTKSEPTVSKRQVTNLIACRDGVVTEMSVLNGFPVCKVGQAVRKGQLLVSGYADWEYCTQATRSLGEIYAMTQRKITVRIPVTCLKKVYTGETHRTVYLTVGRKRIKISGNSGISTPNCDKMVEEKPLALPGGYQFPLKLTVETCRMYELEPRALEKAEAEDLLLQYAQRTMTGEMVAGTILQQDHKLRKNGETYEMTVVAGCREMIAVSEPAEFLTTNEDANGADN